LRGVVFKERVALAPDHFIQDKKRNIGRVTSLADLPGVPHTVGLALVRTEQSEPGTEIVVQSGEREIPATVAALPLAL
ncbi:MAG: glycine cleavage system aminomethyltransferase GcvT, partial [Candidatus Methylomirabilis sp.]|nr:glycine cleavage system aminomethyltransferase GcvT [Deltaproteobacteria bacterium]